MAEEYQILVVDDDAAIALGLGSATLLSTDGTISVILGGAGK